jgi:hypothetical protein
VRSPSNAARTPTSVAPSNPKISNTCIRYALSLWMHSRRSTYGAASPSRRRAFWS